MQTKDELVAKIMAMAQDYKQIKLSSPAQKPLQLDTFTKEEVQGLNAKLKQFDGIKDKIKDKAQLDEAGKILAEELNALIPAFLAKYAMVAEGQQKQLVGVKAKAEELIPNLKAIQTSFTQANDGYSIETIKFTIEDIGEMQYTKNNEFEQWRILRKIRYSGKPTATGIAYIKVFIDPKELYDDRFTYNEFPSSCTPEYVGCTDNLKLCEDKAIAVSKNPTEVGELEFYVYWRKKITTAKPVEKKALSFTVGGKNIVLKSGESYKITVTNLRFEGKTDKVVASIDAENAEIMYAAAALYYNPTATLEIQGSVFIRENEGWDDFVKYSNVNDYTWGTLADRRAAKVKALVIKLYNGYPKNIANYRPIENRIKISRANINELRKNPNISQQSGILIIKN